METFKGVKHIKDVDDIYRTCDYITIHVPLLDSTRKMINQDAIDLMKEKCRDPELLHVICW